MSDNFRRIKSYVIRAARMSDAQKRAYETLGPDFVLGKDDRLDWAERFPEAQRHLVEIGFGMGDATRRMAQAHPDWAVAGIEVHRPGIGKLLWWIGRLKLDNIVIIEGDAVEIVRKAIPVESVDGIHIWFPDPWPKKRHHKRRLITKDVVESLVRILRPGGVLHVATDWESYAENILQVLGDVKGLKNRFKDWAPKPDYRPDTKFENRGIAADRVIRDIIFEKEHI